MMLDVGWCTLMVWASAESCMGLSNVSIALVKLQEVDEYGAKRIGRW